MTKNALSVQDFRILEYAPKKLLIRTLSDIVHSSVTKQRKHKGFDVASPRNGHETILQPVFPVINAEKHAQICVS